jgi:hypothetical protein
MGRANEDIPQVIYHRARRDIVISRLTRAKIGLPWHASTEISSRLPVHLAKGDKGEDRSA